MALETVFYTQIGSLVVFIGALFLVYRVLVNQKDATIQLLKEKCSFLEDKLEDALNQAPDVLAKSLSDRVEYLTGEIHRLSEDKLSNQELIDEKERELEDVQNEADELSRQIFNAREMMSEYFCPECKAPMAQRHFHSESVEYQGRELDVDHEYVLFECGLTMHDEHITQPCKNA